MTTAATVSSRRSKSSYGAIEHNVVAIVTYLHLLGAAVWVGGLVVLAATMSAVRSVSDDRRVIGAIARRYAVVSWVAMGLLVVTGVIQAIDYGWTGLLMLKASLVLASIILVIWHTLGARNQLPAIRGMIQALIMILALIILGIAVAL
jgi:putative copper export protein